MKVKVITYDSIPASYDKENRCNPVEFLNKIGVTYNHKYFNSMGDSWWFWGCINVPNELPKYFSLREENPLEYIGWGLSDELAKSLSV